MNVDRKKHWETVYETKSPDEVSWTQEIPKTSLAIIDSFGLDQSAKIIDIGGGDSKLVDHLLGKGFTNITVLDISEKALERAKHRLGEKGKMVTWIVSDILDFQPIETYNVWHDRAAFHFLISEIEIEKYQSIVEKSEFLVIGTFSENGPLKCSGLEITQYSEEKLVATFKHNFDKIDAVLEDHQTPFGTTQNFLFCSLRNKEN
ncbi:class I SAM-dependent methyltransferase [Kaistella antarctica]|uniref:SAM-dependent methyltransferase n=1 Tax=Kaistella antarctica TaxID=266748 RepID=A0A448NNP2_9FLAO|nr:class I SAM-dependent methyltransferase [Kaistella antarctica]KEY19705.1 SAM-dependent methyltransferase [Kaistella antarctica]SEV98744.1 Methyltransferase domain-containing protein [Kaistella antarctica]VEH96693.1 Trans-aconitate methyltransferase [Kaistella antarctica]